MAMQTIQSLLIAIVLSVGQQVDARQVDQVRWAAQANGVPYWLAHSLVRVESDFNSSAVSHAGAIGLSQVMPDTGRWFCGLEPQDLYKPLPNLQCGLSYLRYLYDKFDSWGRALIAYNRGPSRTLREIKLGIGHGTSERYSRMVLGEE